MALMMVLIHSDLFPVFSKAIQEISKDGKLSAACSHNHETDRCRALPKSSRITMGLHKMINSA